MGHEKSSGTARQRLQVATRGLALAAAVASVPTWATARPLEGVPATGKTAADFAPKGFGVELSVEGELSGDGAADLVVVLLEGPGEEVRERALVWLHRDGDGYRRIATNVGLLACFGCLGINGGDGTPSITVKNRVASVQQWGGAGVAYVTVHKLRHEKDGVRLIGLDTSEYERTTSKASETSVNLLTGAREESRTDEQGRTKKTRTKGKPAPVKLEDVKTDAS